MKKNRVGLFLAVSITTALVLALMPVPGMADKNVIIFATAPTQTPSATIKQYEPLVNYLSKAAGKKIVIKTTSSFLEYTNEMRKGDYDMLFDGPQFVAWRMERLGDKVLARIPGDIRYVVVVKDGLSINKLDDLVGQRVCSFASPNLLTLGFLNKFPNPARQPVIIPVRSFKGAMTCIRAGRGVAVVLRDKFSAKQNHKGLTELYAAKHAYPNRTFTISGKFSKETRDKLTAALLSPEAQKLAAPILKPLNVKKIIPANPADYTSNLAKLLKPVWGFYMQ